MRTLSGFFMAAIAVGILFAVPSVHASEKLTKKVGFLLAQYQSWENYDPQAIMNKWTGQVLNMSEQPTELRPSSDNSLMYGNGSREYPSSSYMYPPQSSSQMVSPSDSQMMYGTSPYSAPTYYSPYQHLPQQTMPGSYQPSYNSSPGMYPSYQPSSPAPYQGFSPSPAPSPYQTSPQPGYFYG